MERMQVTAQPRTVATKGQLKALRKSGAVPGIVYGKKTDPIPVTVDSKDITAILQSPSGVNTLVDLNVDGNKETVMIKELTRDILLADRYLHVDFLRISLRDKLEVQVTITLVGEAVGVKDGGILQQQLREVTLKCLPTSIPESVELDISGLAIGESLTVADLTVPADSEFISEADEVIVSIIAPRVEEEAEAAEEAEDTEAPAEETADAETDTE